MRILFEGYLSMSMTVQMRLSREMPRRRANCRQTTKEMEKIDRKCQSMTILADHRG
jgi:hypothetical protein